MLDRLDIDSSKKSSCYLTKQQNRSPAECAKGRQEQDCTPAKRWNWLQDHQQEAWRERENCWCGHLESAAPCKILLHALRKLKILPSIFD